MLSYTRQDIIGSLTLKERNKTKISEITRDQNKAVFDDMRLTTLRGRPAAFQS